MSAVSPNRLLSLSVKGLQRLESINHENDFTFVVGDEQYSCPSFVAEFVLSDLKTSQSTNFVWKQKIQTITFRLFSQSVPEMKSSLKTRIARLVSIESAARK
jgi:hypothetical protein